MGPPTPPSASRFWISYGGHSWLPLLLLPLLLPPSFLLLRLLVQLAAPPPCCGERNGGGFYPHGHCSLLLRPLLSAMQAGLSGMKSSSLLLQHCICACSSLCSRFSVAFGHSLSSTLCRSAHHSSSRALPLLARCRSAHHSSSRALLCGADPVCWAHWLASFN